MHTDDDQPVDPQLISDLVDMIYAVAMDADHWPQLIQALSRTADRPADTGIPGNQESLLGEALLPHLERATTLARQLHQSHERNLSLESILDKIPIGIIILDPESKVLGKNLRADRILADNTGLSLEHDRLRSHSRETTTQLRKLVSQVCEASGTTEECARTHSVTGHKNTLPLSLLITPSPNLPSGQTRATVFIATPDAPAHIPLSRLQGLYGLTEAESKLVNGLVNGKDIESICKERGITRNTARTHLKAVFSKTRTSRQSELVRLVLLGPALTLENDTPPETDNRPGTLLPVDYAQGHDFRDHCIRLEDGRTLGYREYGKTNGMPVVLMHTMPASHQQMHPDTSLPGRLGIRLIVPDRPGIGLSSPQPGRSIPDWRDDFRQLARHTGLKKFGVVGYGSGTPYALCIAAAFPDAVKHVAIASAVVNDYSLRDLRGIGMIQRMLYTTARTMPSLLIQLIRQGAHAAQKNPDRYIDILMNNNAAPDREALDDPAVKHNLKSGYLDTSNDEGRHMAEDSLLQIKPWGFDLNTVKADVHIWHGKQNQQNPLVFSRRLADRIPRCQLNHLPDAGHFLIYSNYWPEILCHAAGIQEAYA